MIADGSYSILRIEIDGAWDGEEFANFYSSISNLYRVQIRLLDEEFRSQYPDMRYEDGDELIDWDRAYKKRSLNGNVGAGGPLSAVEGPTSTFYLRGIFSPAKPTGFVLLKGEVAVVAINYRSPGFTDFVGVGKAMEQVRKLLEVLIKHREESKVRLAQGVRLDLENQRIRIDNARSFVALAQQIGMGPEDMARLVAFVDQQQLPLSGLVAWHKISAVTELHTDEYDHKFDRVPEANVGGSLKPLNFDPPIQPPNADRPPTGDSKPDIDL